MNKIGFNVLAWSAGMDESLFPIAERLKKIGYDGVVLYVQFLKHNCMGKLQKQVDNGIFDNG